MRDGTTTRELRVESNHREGGDQKQEFLKGLILLI